MATLAVLVLVAGCGGGTGAGAGGAYSCADGVPDADGGTGMITRCMEITGGTAQDLANNQANCAAAHWLFALAPCPRAGALGGCRETLAGSTITSWQYTGTVSEIQMSCAQAASGGLPIQFVSP